MFKLLLLGGLVVFALRADARSDAVDRLLAPLRSADAPGCAVGVMQDGRFLYQEAFGRRDLEQGGPISTATAFNVASMSKQFTAAALYFLIDAGQVRVSDSVRRYIPELPAYADAMTVGDLLHHTSGLRDIAPLLEVAGRLGEPLDVAAGLRLLASQSALNFAPGSDYEYTNSDYLLLGLIVERLSGRSLAAFAEERIFRPLGMTHSEFRGRIDALADRATGYMVRGGQFRKSAPPPLVAGDGGLYTSLEDLLRWDQNFYTGSLGGKALLEFLQTRGELRSGDRISYAAGLLMGRYRGMAAVSHPGWLPGFRAEMIRFPSEHLSVACLCNRGDADSAELARGIASVYLAGKLKHLLRPANVDYVTSRFAELDGTWESKQGWIMRTWSGVDGLTVESAEGRHKLFPLNRRQLFADDGTTPLILTELTADRIRLAWDGALPVVYDRIAAVMPKRDDLPGFAGDYHNADTGARYRIVAEGDRLLIAAAAGWRTALEPAGPDRFVFGPWSMRFKRAPGGQVEGLELHRARLWNLRFEKVE